MKKIFCLILLFLNIGCGLDLVLSQASVAETKKEEAKKADQQAKRMVEKMKKAEEERDKRIKKAADQYN